MLTLSKTLAIVLQQPVVQVIGKRNMPSISEVQGLLYFPTTMMQGESYAVEYKRI